MGLHGQHSSTSAPCVPLTELAGTSGEGHDAFYHKNPQKGTQQLGRSFHIQRSGGRSFTSSNQLPTKLRAGTALSHQAARKQHPPCEHQGEALTPWLTLFSAKALPETTLPRPQSFPLDLGSAPDPSLRHIIHPHYHQDLGVQAQTKVLQIDLVVVYPLSLRCAATAPFQDR